jgi:hypothetical protein
MNMSASKDSVEYVYFLRQLIDGKDLFGSTLGIAKLATDKGPETLTSLQSKVLELAIDELVSRECNSCHHEIPWPELYQAIDTRRCLTCARKVSD